MAASDPLYDIFCSFAAFGAGKGATPELDSAKMAKLARECGLLDKSVTTTQVDLAFAKVKDKGGRKINYDQFRELLHQLAAMKYPGDADGYHRVVHTIVTSDGPKVDAVKPDAGGIFAKLTDTSLYTGAHKERFDESGRGKGLEGRDSVATGGGTVGAYHGGAVADLSQITRSDMRGGTHITSATSSRSRSPLVSERRASTEGATKKSPSPATTAAAPTSARRSPSAAVSAAPAATRASPSAAVGGGAGGGGGSFDLYDVFLSYCSFGGTSATSDEMDNAKFAKLCREAGIIDKRVTPAAVDIMFNKVKEKTKRTIRYDQFQDALAQLSTQKFPDEEPATAHAHLIDIVLAAGGPALVGTSKVATGGIYAKLTDSSLYTGAHKERFDESGRGKGLEGRDSVATGSGSHSKYHGGAVHDLSQITRS